MVTSEPVRDRIAAFTRSMSAATRSTRRSTDGAGWLSNGITTATSRSGMRTCEHRNAMLQRQVRGLTRGNDSGRTNGAGDADQGERRQPNGPARSGTGSRCCCPVTMKKRPSPRWSTHSALRFRPPQSMSTITIRPTAPLILLKPPAPWCAPRRHQGKGYVVRRMFADVDADIYVLADGDATYDAPSAPAMIARLIDEKLDMVVGARVHREEAAYRRGHQTGNRLLTGFVTQHLRTVVQRHAVGLPGVLAALRESRFRSSPAVSRSRRN